MPHLKHNRRSFRNGPTGINALNPLARLLSHRTLILLRIPSRDKSDGTEQHMSVIAHDDLITRTYLTEPDADTGERFHAKIVKKIVSLEKGLE
jgi:hypothetical protein